MRVYGTVGGLLWDQEDPDRLLFLDPGGDATIARAGDPGLCAAAERATHLFPGAPEGFLGAFANIYANAADTMRARLAGREPTDLELDFPGRRRRRPGGAVHGAGGRERRRHRQMVAVLMIRP